MLAALERAAYRGAKALSVIGLGGLCLLAVMTLADGAGRSLFKHSIEGVRDIGGLVIAVTVATCLPMGLIERGHIAVQVFHRVGARCGRVADAFASLMVCGAVLAMAWQMQSYAAKLGRAHETTWVLQIPAAPFWWVVAAILWGAVLIQAIVLALDVGRLFGWAENTGPPAGTRDPSAT